MKKTLANCGDSRGMLVKLNPVNTTIEKNNFDLFVRGVRFRALNSFDWKNLA